MPPLIDSPLTRELDRQGRRRDWMARQLGVGPWTFSRIEGGQQPAPEDWYDRAADILGVPASELRPADEAEAVA